MFIEKAQRLVEEHIMYNLKAIRFGHTSSAISAAVAFALVALASGPVSANGIGSDNTMFKRHFWRGQAFHGEGYHPQVSDISRDLQRNSTRTAID